MAQTVDGVRPGVKENAAGILAFARRQVDSVISPDARKAAYDQALAFASARPVLLSFVVANTVFSILPLLVFATFALSILTSALGAAFLFALFWIGVATLVLVPVLFLTSSVAVIVWLWATVSFALARWAYTTVVSGTAAGRQRDGDDVTIVGAKAVTGVDEEKSADGGWNKDAE